MFDIYCEFYKYVVKKYFVNKNEPRQRKIKKF